MTVFADPADEIELQDREFVDATGEEREPESWVADVRPRRQVLDRLAAQLMG